MSDKAFTAGIFVLVVTVSLLVGGLLLAGTKIGRTEIRLEAVKKGHAEWLVDNERLVKFEWKKCSTCKPKGKQ